MFAVFDVIRKAGIGSVVSETKVLKLVRGSELLEQVEFPDLQEQVRMDEERALSQHISDNHLRVLVIVKRPLLALRYTLSDGRIRKTQMNFVPFSGCDVALETLRAAGLPIRDKDLPHVQGQRLQSSDSQPHSQERPGSLNDGPVQRLQSSESQPHSLERPGSLNASQTIRPDSSQSAFPCTSQPLSQEASGFRNVGYGSMTTSAQPSKVNLRPTSAPGGVNQDEFSRPISASSRSTLDAFASNTTVTGVPAVAQPRAQSGLLPSPVFNGSYEPFGNFQVRPMSAPEPTQTRRDDIDAFPPSQMPPPRRVLPFPQKKIHPFRRDEAASQEEPSQEKPAATKTQAKRQTKPRAQPARPKTSKTKVGATTLSSDSLAPISPSPTFRDKEKAPSSSEPPKARAKVKVPASSAPTKVPSPELQATTPSSEPPAPSIIFRKRSLTDRSVDRPNKRQAQSRTETVTETMTEAFTTAIPEQPVQAKSSQTTDPLIDISSPNLLDSIDNFMRRYHDLPATKPPPKTAQEHLAEFAAQSDEDRAKAIDNQICECIKDENFGRLMEDVEGAWKRIGLGV